MKNNKIISIELVAIAILALSVGGLTQAIAGEQPMVPGRINDCTPKPPPPQKPC